MMHDTRAHVALLVDFANLRQQCSRRAEPTTDGHPAAYLPSGRELADALVHFAEGVGRVGLSRAYADWLREPELARELSGTRLVPVLVPATADGEDRSHIRLVVDAMEALYNGDEPDAFIVVSGDPSLVPLVQAIRADGSEVIVVAADAEQAEEMHAAADQFIPLGEILAGRIGDPVEARSFRAERAGAARVASARGAGRTRRGDEAGRGRGASDFDAPRALQAPDLDGYEWSRFVRLIDELEQRLPFVGVRYLVNKVLGPHNCGIDDPRLKRDLINRAVDDGLIEMYAVGNVNDRTDPVTACRLDRENDLVVDILGPGTVAAAAREDEEELDESDEFEGDGVVESGCDEYTPTAASPALD